VAPKGGYSPLLAGRREALAGLGDARMPALGMRTREGEPGQGVRRLVLVLDKPLRTGW
jgi:hypothetical protein